MLLVLELASFITCDTSTCYLNAFVLLLVSQVCTCQSSYFSVSTVSLALFIIVFFSLVHVIVIFVSLKS